MKIKRSGLISMIVMAVSMLVVIMMYLENFSKMTGIYAGVNLLLCVVAFFILIFANAKRVSPGLYIILCFISLTSIMMYYRWMNFYDPDKLTTEVLFKPASALLFILLAYAAGVFVAEATLHIYPPAQLLLMFAGPVLFLITRISGQEINGSYNWLGPIMPSEISKVSFVFAVAYITYANITVRQKLKWFMGYVAVQAFACVIANEFGTMLLILLSAFIFCLCDKDLRPLLTLFVTCGVALCGLILLVSAKARARILIFIDPVKALASENEYISGQAVVVQRFLSNVKYSGLFGSEYQLPRSSLPANMTTDYVFQTMILDYGKLFCAVVVVMVLFVLFYLLSATARNPKERKIIDAAVILLISNTIISVCGNLLIAPLTGVTCPFISLVSSKQANIIFYFLLGFALALTEKKEAS